MSNHTVCIGQYLTPAYTTFIITATKIISLYVSLYWSTARVFQYEMCKKYGSNDLVYTTLKIIIYIKMMNHFTKFWKILWHKYCLCIMDCIIRNELKLPKLAFEWNSLLWTSIIHNLRTCRKSSIQKKTKTEKGQLTEKVHIKTNNKSSRSGSFIRSMTLPFLRYQGLFKADFFN